MTEEQKAILELYDKTNELMELLGKTIKQTREVGELLNAKINLLDESIKALEKGTVKMPTK